MGRAELVRREFPSARVVSCANRGFGHANNRGYMATDAPYILFLNPDTEVLDGTFGDLVAEMDKTSRGGGNRRQAARCRMAGSIRRSGGSPPSAGRSRTLWENGCRGASRGRESANSTCPLTSERRHCDWVSGSFMLARREALDSAGIFDERFFVYSEEVDLCLRIKRAGWRVVHLPSMTIVHHAGKAGFSPRVAAQDAYARRQYLDKNAGWIERVLVLGRTEPSLRDPRKRPGHWRRRPPAKRGSKVSASDPFRPAPAAVRTTAGAGSCAAHVRNLDDGRVRSRSQEASQEQSALRISRSYQADL